jgi:hypothetical protein
MGPRDLVGFIDLWILVFTYILRYIVPNALAPREERFINLLGKTWTARNTNTHLKTHKHYSPTPHALCERGLATPPPAGLALPDLPLCHSGLHVT